MEIVVDNNRDHKVEKETKMRFSKDDESRRFWLWFGHQGDNIGFEIGSIPSWDLGFHLGVDTEHLVLGLYLLLGDFYFTIDYHKISGWLKNHPNHFYKRTWDDGKDGSYWEERNTRLHIDFRHLIISGELWVNMNNQPRGRYFYWFLQDKLLGRAKYFAEVVQEGETVIDMPEGEYPATYKIEKCTWKRPRWPFPTKRDRIEWEIPVGIPHEGKGENSWDVGMDATFGSVGPYGGNLHTARKEFALDILRERQKHGRLCDDGYGKWLDEGLAKLENQEEPSLGR